MTQIFEEDETRRFYEYIYICPEAFCSSRWMRVEYRARIFKLLSIPTQASNPQNLFLMKNISIVELILERVGEKEGPENEDNSSLKN
jgi:hypothetical protein